MNLNIASSPWLSRFSPPNTTKLSEYSSNNNNITLFSLLLRSSTSLSYLKTYKLFQPRASLKEPTQSNSLVLGDGTSVLTEELLSRVSATKDADQALQMIAQYQSENSEQ
ncbi:hypothetical protein REPUB_Repub08aG0165300 [Reevesia pubescens]